MKHTYSAMPEVRDVEAYPSLKLESGSRNLMRLEVSEAQRRRFLVQGKPEIYPA